MNNKKRLTEHQGGNQYGAALTWISTLWWRTTHLRWWIFKEYDLCSPPRLIKDSLDHSRLLENLKTLGVRCTGLEGFRRYLCGRKQYVSIGAETSSLGAFSHGVHPRSAPHFLFTMHVVWSSRLTLMMIYRRSRLRAIGIVSWST